MNKYNQSIDVDDFSLLCEHIEDEPSIHIRRVE
jgi:hypothetical protein